jgi:hypothetical protein
MVIPILREMEYNHSSIIRRKIMSDTWEFPLTIPVGELARQINDEVPQLVLDKFKEGLRSMKSVDPRYFEKDMIRLCADQPMQAYTMGCYARTRLEDDSRRLLEFLKV